MSKMKDYAKPFLRIELFHPQDYVAACEYYIVGVDPTNNYDITASTKFWPDKGVVGEIDGDEFVKGEKYNTDGQDGWFEGTVIKAWWAHDFKIAEKIHDDHSLFPEYQRNGEAGYVDCVVTSNDHYHPGEIRMTKSAS